MELATSFSETVHGVISAGSVVDTLQQVADLTVETIDGCDFAGIFVLQGDRVTTTVSTDLAVTEIDTLQHCAGEALCLDATAHGGSIYALDLADDARWPRFGPKATRAEIRSVLAVGLSANGTCGALNL